MCNAVNAHIIYSNATELQVGMCTVNKSLEQCPQETETSVDFRGQEGESRKKLPAPLRTIEIEKQGRTDRETQRERERERERERQTNSKTDRQTDKKESDPDSQTNKQTDKQPTNQSKTSQPAKKKEPERKRKNTQTNRHKESDSQTDRQKVKQTYKHIHITRRSMRCKEIAEKNRNTIIIK